MNTSQPSVKKDISFLLTNFRKISKQAMVKQIISFLIREPLAPNSNVSNDDISYEDIIDNSKEKTLNESEFVLSDEGFLSDEGLDESREIVLANAKNQSEYVDEKLYHLNESTEISQQENLQQAEILKTSEHSKDHKFKEVSKNHFNCKLCNFSSMKKSDFSMHLKYAHTTKESASQ